LCRRRSESFRARTGPISRVIKALTEAIARSVLKELLLTAEEVPGNYDYMLDGTLFLCWSRRNHRESWSDKHRMTGMNAHLVLPVGGFAWVSDS